MVRSWHHHHCYYHRSGRLRDLKGIMKGENTRHQMKAYSLPGRVFKFMEVVCRLGAEGVLLTGAVGLQGCSTNWNDLRKQIRPASALLNLCTDNKVRHLNGTCHYKQSIPIMIGQWHKAHFQIISTSGKRSWEENWAWVLDILHMIIAHWNVILATC